MGLYHMHREPMIINHKDYFCPCVIKSSKSAGVVPMSHGIMKPDQTPWCDLFDFMIRYLYHLQFIYVYTANRKALGR